MGECGCDVGGYGVGSRGGGEVDVECDIEEGCVDGVEDGYWVLSGDCGVSGGCCGGVLKCMGVLKYGFDFWVVVCFCRGFIGSLF